MFFTGWKWNKMRKRIEDEFTYLSVSRQRKYQLRMQRDKRWKNGNSPRDPRRLHRAGRLKRIRHSGGAAAASPAKRAFRRVSRMPGRWVVPATHNLRSAIKILRPKARLG